MRKLHYIIIFVSMILTTKNIKAQVPTSDPLFNQVFIDNFDSVRTNVWALQNPWGQDYNYDTAHCWNGAGPFIHTAGLNLNPADTSNIQLSTAGGTTSIKLKAKSGNIGNITANRTDFGLCDSPCGYSTVCQSHSANNCYPNNNGNCYCSWAVPVTYKYSNALLYGINKIKLGYFEIRFRMPNFTATSHTPVSPTFWLYGANASVSWSELDVYEIDATQTTFNWGNAIHVNANAGSSGQPTNDGMSPASNIDFTGGGWHTAAVNWTPNYIDFYQDGLFVRRSVNDTNKYLIPMQIIIGNGMPASNFCHGDVDSLTPKIITYEIDYVKVLQPLCDCSTDKTYCTTSFTSKIYKSLTLGGSSCSMVFSSSSNSSIQSIKANNYVVLQEGFEINASITNSITIDVQPYCSDSMKYIQQITPPVYPMPTNYMQNRYGAYRD